MLIDCSKLNLLHRQWTSQWHTEITLQETEPPWSAIQCNHHCNFLLWHEEDIARRDDISALQVREAKRNIDRFNQQRNDATEEIDHWILVNLKSYNMAHATAQLHSETPGMMIDRLSIMALKEYHMQEQTLREDVSREHVSACLAKVQILIEQQADLSRCLSELLEAYVSGNKRLKIYRQFKMYNDPNLNPQLYGRTV